MEKCNVKRDASNIAESKMGIGESIGRKGTHWTQIHVQNQAASRWEHTAIQSKLVAKRYAQL